MPAIIVLLIIIAVAVWLIASRRRDWYVVEWRICEEKSLCQDVFGAPQSYDLSTEMLRRNRLKLTNVGSGGATLTHESGAQAVIVRRVFRDLAAAQMLFQRYKILRSTRDDYQKIYIWRVVAKSRYRATTRTRLGFPLMHEALITEPEHLWYEPQHE